ncbi:hypothetical protein ABE453_11735 [Brevundimonas diminuta]|uniref:hypothetical protein n=1 Tax=Brevundimonas diminuta TaxID=293 RepID=UPI0032084E90
MEIGFRTAALAVAALVLSACNFHATLPTSDPTLNAEAEAFYGDMIAARDDAVVARMTSENDAAEVKAQLPMLRGMIGDAATPEPKLVQSRKTTGSQGETYELEQDYVYADRTVRVYSAMMREKGEWKLHAFNINVRMTGEPKAVEAEKAA